MSTSKIVVLLAFGAVLVVGSVLLRVLTGGKHEIKTTDLVFLVIPLLLVALATGKLKGVDLFGVKADLSQLWATAAQTKIAAQVAPGTPATVQDAVQIVEMATKGGIQELRQLVERKIQALEFKLGQGGYYGPAIKTYFEALSGSFSLRVVVVDKPDGKLFGIYDAADLIGYLRVAGEQGYRQFQQLLNSGSESAKAELAKLPGFVGADHAVTAVTSKREALARMEQLNTDRLPVVNDQQRFVGTVERTKLTASLILAITDKLESR
jgi:CBS domain-containing protein